MQLGTIVLAAVLAAASGVAVSKEPVFELWRCKVRDGKTLEDVKAANQGWVAFQNGLAPDAGIASWVLTPIVGRTGGFMYLDSFPTLEAWAASRAAEETTDGQSVVAALDAAATCSSSSLHRADPN